MKKLAFLLTAIFIFALSSHVFGQSGTGINPAIGDTITYSVNSHAGSSYAWTVTTDAAGTNTNLLSAGTVVSGSSTSNSIELVWNSPTIGSIYYLHVVETDVNTCTNHKVLAIQPENNFEMDIANVDDAGAGISSTYSTCAPTVTNISWNGSDPVTAGNATDFSYDYGTVTFYYKITATGITNTDWTPVFTIDHNSTGTVAATWDKSIGGAYASSLATDGSDNTITVSEANEFYVKVVVTLGTTDECLTARDIEINLDESASADEFGNIVTSTNQDTIDQTIEARPDTGAISY